jgi:glycosyltransferase involved in cell wall biosynthesis
LKRRAYRRSNLTIVGISRWVTELAQASMLSCFPVCHIANGIDTDIYRPLDPETCRSLLGISTQKRVLLFGAHDQKSPRKGADLLIDALRSLPASLKSDTLLLTMGASATAVSEVTGMTTLDLGFISSDRLKAIVYSAADLFLFPTRQDAFGLVAQESVTCGTPVVSFNVGGVPDIVRPGLTGYLAEPGKGEDFRAGIIKLLEDDALRRRMASQCREIALREYPLEQQTRRYLELYRRVLAQ